MPSTNNPGSSPVPNRPAPGSANLAAQTEAIAPAPVIPSLTDAMALIPNGAFVLTSSYAETRGGVIVRWVQAVSATPPLVMVAIEKGQPLSPVIRDSRRFGLCQLAPEDRVLHRLFEPESPDSGRAGNSRLDPIDPFLGLPTKTTAAGVPILLKALAWLECELTRHLDVEGNCELYIGLVHAGGVLRVASSPTATGAAPTPRSPSTSATVPARGFGRLDRHPTGHGSGNGNGTPLKKPSQPKPPGKNRRG